MKLKQVYRNHKDKILMTFTVIILTIVYILLSFSACQKIEKDSNLKLINQEISIHCKSANQSNLIRYLDNEMHCFDLKFQQIMLVFSCPSCLNEIIKPQK